MKLFIFPAWIRSSFFLFILFLIAHQSNAQLLINEYSASNLTDYPDNYSAYEDWVEIYNGGSSSVSLGGYYLSDKINNPTKWEIPAVVSIPAGGTLLFWTSGRDEATATQRHTNFKLTQTKNNEYLVLTDPSGNILDSMHLEITQLGHSRGRSSDGNSIWSVFQSPTPGASNNSSTGVSGYAAKPDMDMTAGFYSGSITVSLTNNEANSTLRYTLDGSLPSTASPTYTSPLNISSTTIVKAISFSNGLKLPSLMEFNTYFINETHSLPVVSISSNTLQILLGGTQSERPFGTAEYFEESGTRTTFGYGEFNSHGQDSWIHPQRSIDYITRDEMGYDNALHHELYPFSDRKKFQRLILRAEGDDNYAGYPVSTHMRDMYVHTLAEKNEMKLDVRKAAKSVLYVDGQYWGVYSLREKVDDPDFTKYYYDQDKYNIQFIMIWGNTWVEYGDDVTTMNDWNALYNFITTNNMADSANYAYVKSKYNYKSLIDYTLINSYVVCSDWLNWNTAWWRGMDPNGDHKKWGYILWDEDATFGHYINYTGIPTQAPTADPCFPEQIANSFSDPEGHMTILNTLRDNPEFDQYYLTRYMDLLNTGFSCDSMLHVLDSIVTLVTPEMTRHFSRWGGNMTQWQSNVQDLRDYITTRCNYLPSGINGCYNLTGPYDIQIDVFPANAGRVKLNSLNLNNFPWTGSYHGGIDLNLKAVESDTNYKFVRWVTNNHAVSPGDSTKRVSLGVTMGDTIVAHFEVIVGQDEPVQNQASITVFPNPFTESTTLRIEGRVQATEVEVISLMGQVVKRLPIQGNEVEIPAVGLSHGIYIYKVLDRDHHVMGTGKLVVD